MLKGIKMLLVCAISLGFVGMNTASALSTTAPNTVQMGGQVLSSPYIGNMEIGFLALANGTPVFCMKALAPTPVNETLTRAEEVDGGLRYIMQNAYPSKSITGDTNKDRYLTQMALWWYLDRINGYGDDSKSPNANLSPNAKIHASDPHGLRAQAKSLMEQGLNHRNDALPTLGFDLNTEGSALTLTSDGGYYQSGFMSVTSGATVSGLSVVANNAPEGTIFVNENGQQITSFQANQKFRVAVPASSITDLKVNFTVTVSGTASADTGYVYRPSDASKQSIAIVYTKSEKVSKSTPFELVRTGLKISKQDITTKKELPGAKLVLKDAQGNVVAEWISTEEDYYLYNLPAGKYTLEETIAPDGYQLSTEKIEFELTANGVLKEVVMYNEKVPEVPEIPDVPEVPVPDTGIKEGILPVVGVGMLIAGVGMVYRHAKKRS